MKICYISIVKLILNKNLLLFLKMKYEINIFTTKSDKQKFERNSKYIDSKCNHYVCYLFQLIKKLQVSICNYFHEL